MPGSPAQSEFDAQGVSVTQTPLGSSSAPPLDDPVVVSPSGPWVEVPVSSVAGPVSASEPVPLDEPPPSDAGPEGDSFAHAAGMKRPAHTLHTAVTRPWVRFVVTRPEMPRPCPRFTAFVYDVIGPGGMSGTLEVLAAAGVTCE